MAGHRDSRLSAGQRFDIRPVQFTKQPSRRGQVAKKVPRPCQCSCCKREWRGETSRGKESTTRCPLKRTQVRLHDEILNILLLMQQCRNKVEILDLTDERRFRCQ